VLLLILGALFLYYTATSTVQLGAFTSLFGFLSVAVLGIGVVLLLVKPPE
jgi:hypothetical protein